ncbi:hypothetical protein Tco_1331851 [Tanacetum coccineum]
MFPLRKLSPGKSPSPVPLFLVVSVVMNFDGGDEQRQHKGFRCRTAGMEGCTFGGCATDLVVVGVVDVGGSVIEVTSDDIFDMDRATGCASGTIPFIYHGFSIGSNMNLIANWQSLIDQFRGKLSSWKGNLLSIGSRCGLLTLIKAALEIIGIYHMLIF